MLSIIIASLILVGIIVYSIYTYRLLIVLRKKIKSSWDTLDESLNKRFSLLPGLIVMLQTKSPESRDTLQKGVDALCLANASTTKADKIVADKILKNVIEDLFNIYLNSGAEGLDKDRIYSQMYILTEKISSLRQGYNSSVKEYNNKVLKYPSKIIAMIGRFKTDIYYESVVTGKKEEIDSL